MQNSIKTPHSGISGRSAGGRRRSPGGRRAVGGGRRRSAAVGRRSADGHVPIKTHIPGPSKTHRRGTLPRNYLLRQCNEVHSTAMQCIALPSNAMQWNAMCCNVMQNTTQTHTAIAVMKFPKTYYSPTQHTSHKTQHKHTQPLR